METITAIKSSLRQAIKATSARGLKHTSIWLAEMMVGLAEQFPSELHDTILATSYTEADFTFENESDEILLAKSVFDLGEYHRCYHLVSIFQSKGVPLSKYALFLKLYSLYLALETEATEELAKQNESDKSSASRVGVLPNVGMMKQKNNSNNNGYSAALMDKLHRIEVELNETSELDAYLLYLRALVLRRLGAQKHIVLKVLLQSTTLNPLLWCSWLELIGLVTSLQQIEEMELPPGWISLAAVARLKLDLSHVAQARADFTVLHAVFPRSSYILSQLASVAYVSKEYDGALSAHQQVQQQDPCRLTNLDDYSNILYVKGDALLLSSLASHTHSISPHSSVTNCIIGNHYSLNRRHEKSILYFQRAVMIDPSYLPAWMLLGHEYVEMRNIPAAMHAYGRAMSIDERDHRPWYGLGQTYDLLQLGNYGLHYFWRTVNIRPFDSRMWVALGGCFEKQKKMNDAVYCYACAEATDTKIGESRLNIILRIAELSDDRTSSAYNHSRAVRYYSEYLDMVSQYPALMTEGTNACSHALRVVGEYYAYRGLDSLGAAFAHTNRAPSVESPRSFDGRGATVETLETLKRAEMYLAQLPTSQEMVSLLQRVQKGIHSLNSL